MRLSIDILPQYVSTIITAGYRIYVDVFRGRFWVAIGIEPSYTPSLGPPGKSNVYSINAHVLHIVFVNDGAHGHALSQYAEHLIGTPPNSAEATLIACKHK